MKHTLALLSVLGAAAAQGVTEVIAPPGSYPDGCSKAADGPLWVSVLSVKEARKRATIEEVRRPIADPDRRPRDQN